MLLLIFFSYRVLLLGRKITKKREKSERIACFSFLFRVKVNSAKPKLQKKTENLLRFVSKIAIFAQN
jgi:hypothetical protein